MSLFRLGHFELASGEESNFKIDCDFLGASDWQTLAALLNERMSYALAIGVPTGGVLLAEWMNDQNNSGGEGILLVDDVFTTGGSLTAFADKLDLCAPRAAVVFARTPPPSWVFALFQMR